VENQPLRSSERRRLVAGVVIGLCFLGMVLLAVTPIQGSDASCGSLLDRRGETFISVGPVQREDPSCGSARVGRGAIVVVLGILAGGAALGLRCRPEATDRKVPSRLLTS